MQLFTIVPLAACGEDPPVFFLPSGDPTDGSSDAGSDPRDVGEPDLVVRDIGEDADAEVEKDLDTSDEPEEDADVELDADTDVAEDLETPDAEVGEDADVQLDADVEPDADIEPDASPDVEPDVVPDAEPDAIPDVEPDAIPDADPGCTSIGDLRVTPLGFVDATLCDVVITYVSPFGFFVQEPRRTGPAINIFEDAGGWLNPEAFAPGDVVSMPVSETGEVRGMEQVIAHGRVTIDRGVVDVETLVQDLTATRTLPSEANESELGRITDAEVTDISGRDLIVRYAGLDAEARVEVVRRRRSSGVPLPRCGNHA